MALIVQKYGGTSVGSAKRIEKVAERIARTVADGHLVAVVVSAMGHTTDELVALAAAITDEPDRREMDVLLSTGEQVSIALVSMALQKSGLKAASFTGWQAGIETEPAHGGARIQTIHPEVMQDFLAAGGTPVIAGFQGIANGSITTLGRGGSDTTAVAVAAALKADLCEIYTDVEGVYTADPRYVKNARRLDRISYEEMLELANLGSQVLHPRAVETAKKHGVALVVRSTFSQNEGTVITNMNSMENERVVTGVAFEKEVARVALLKIPLGTPQLSHIFGSLAKERVNVDVILQSVVREGEVDVSFTVAEGDLDRAIAVCEGLAEVTEHKGVMHEKGLAKISIVGAGMISNPGVAAKMFTALESSGAHVKMVSTSEIKVSCIVEQEFLQAGLDKVHETFELER